MRHARPPTAETVPNLAPMVDVIMVLLVFFILGASLELAREGAIETDLDPRSGPGAGAAVEIIPTARIALHDGDAPDTCRILVMGRPIEPNTFDALRALLAQRVRDGADPQSPIVLSARGGIRWHWLVKAMDAAAVAGFRNIQFAVHLGTEDVP